MVDRRTAALLAAVLAVAACSDDSTGSDVSDVAVTTAAVGSPGTELEFAL